MSGNQHALHKQTAYYYWAMAALVPLIIYFYFLKWRTGTVYGDDLYIFQYHDTLHSFSEKIGMPVSFGKYRPVHGMSMHFLIEWFQKHAGAYYCFNIAVQAINALLFALIANIFLRSPPLSLLFGLTVGLSRFSLFNVVQLLNGGALEGMAMSFFLASLYFMVSALTNRAAVATPARKQLYWSIVFANLAMYTHERYIVLLPFIVLLVLLYPPFRKLRFQQKTFMIVLCVGSIAINVLLKKLFFNMPFFMGTASTGMVFSLSSAFGFLTEGILSLFQFNYGPQFLVGITFAELPLPEKLLVLFVFAGILSALFLYLRHVKKSWVQQNNSLHFWLFLSLIILSGLFLVPAILTIRLEQRWLQASWSIFVLLFVIAASSISFANSGTKTAVLALFCLLLLWVDANYLNRGGKYIYLTYSEQAATEFEEAINKGLIKPGTKRIFIWEQKRDPNTENAIRWDLGDGYFFNFYQGHDKKIVFVDSVYKDHRLADTALVHFDRNADQLLYVDSNVHDITGEFLQDSLQSFSRLLHSEQTGEKLQFFSRPLSVTAATLERFTTSGFYGNENGIRWTDGHATISFNDGNLVKDSLVAELDTYMPEACKNIVPAIIIIGQHDKQYKPVTFSRQGDTFRAVFYFEAPIQLKSIKLPADQIKGDARDQRVLSFPFKALRVQ